MSVTGADHNSKGVDRTFLFSGKFVMLEMQLKLLRYHKDFKTSSQNHPEHAIVTAQLAGAPAFVKGIDGQQK